MFIFEYMRSREVKIIVVFFSYFWEKHGLKFQVNLYSLTI